MMQRRQRHAGVAGRPMRLFPKGLPACRLSWRRTIWLSMDGLSAWCGSAERCTDQVGGNAGQGLFRSVIVPTLRLKFFKEPLNNVTSAAKTRQKRVKNRSLLCVNEDFEPVFNAVFASAVVIQRFLNRIGMSTASCRQ